MFSDLHDLYTFLYFILKFLKIFIIMGEFDNLAGSTHKVVSGLKGNCIDFFIFFSSYFLID